jgi:membrane associated rhomboid family serine protease
MREFATYFANRVSDLGENAAKSRRLMRNAGIALQLFGVFMLLFQLRRGDFAHFLPPLIIVAMGTLLFGLSSSFPPSIADHPSRVAIQEALDNLFFTLWWRKFPQIDFLVLSSVLLMAYAYGSYLGLPTVHREFAVKHGDIKGVASVYRIISYGLFHERWSHLLGNLSSLAIAWAGVRIFASARKTYFLMAVSLVVAGVSCALIAKNPVVGFSGVVFGFIAYGSCQMLGLWREVPRAALALHLGFGMAVAMPTFYLPGVSVAGHVGGAIAGVTLYAIETIRSLIRPETTDSVAGDAPSPEGIARVRR